MKIESNGVTIHLEQNEIMDFWNIIMFALDYQVVKQAMTENELKLARELADTVDKIK